MKMDTGTTKSVFFGSFRNFMTDTFAEKLFLSEG